MAGPKCRLRRAAAERRRAQCYTEAGAVREPRRGAAAGTVCRAAGRVQPVDQQGPRDPLPSLPAIADASQASPCETAQVSKQTEQNTGP